VRPKASLVAQATRGNTSMKCADGSCQFRSVRGLLTSLLRLAKNWHTAEVAAGRLKDSDWADHYGKYMAERLTPYLASLQAHGHDATPPAPPVEIPFLTPEERGDSASYPSPASVGAEYVGSRSNGHVGGE
jgi:hypothetical protein